MNKTMRLKIGISIVFIFPLSLMLFSCFTNECPAGEEGDIPDVLTVYIGTITQSGSEGIYKAEFHIDNGSLSDLSLEAKTNNPTFLTFSPSGEALIAVSETSPGKVLGYHLDKNGLVLSGAQYSEGDGACHVAVHSSGKWVVVSNYGSGTVASYPLNEKGKPGVVVSRFQYEGDHPHAHSATFDRTGKWVIIADLGNDKLMIYQFDPANGVMTPAEIPFAPTADGAGPRHAVFHPNGQFFYVANELNSTVDCFSWDSEEGSLILMKVYDLLEPDYSGNRNSADIHLSEEGRFLYVSNRGDANSLTVFGVDEETGILNLIERQSCGGIHPRNFTLDPSGKYLLVANRDTNEIVVFNRNEKTGKITETDVRLTVSKPMCVLFQLVNR